LSLLPHNKSVKLPFIALLAGALTVTTPVIAKADSVAAWVYNVEPTPLRFAARCVTGNTTWHQFQVGAGQYAAIYADNWKEYCDSSYEASFGTNQSDGSVAQQFAHLTNGHFYVLVKTRSAGYTVHDAQSMIVVVNASSRELPLNLFCGNAANTRLTVAPNARSWMFTGNPSACSPYSGSVVEVVGERAPLPTTPMPNGYIYTLTWNDDAHSWNIRSAKVGTGVEGAAI
jgi:hypothetical protein